ncbi:MAG: hypothetical protein QM775_00210 [Pirellulales bacterium]
MKTHHALGQMRMADEMRTTLDHQPIARFVERIFQRSRKLVARRSVKYGRQQLLDRRMIARRGRQDFATLRTRLVHRRRFAGDHA